MAHRVLAGICVLVLAVAAGCGDGGEDAGPPRTVRVGAVVPLTGASAATGRSTLEGVRLAAAVVNEDMPGLDLPLAAGRGLPRAGGAPVEVVPADFGEDPDRAAAQTERLIATREVVAVLGSYFSSATLAASERADRLGIPFVNGDSSAPELTEGRDLGFFFRTGPSDRTFAETFFEFLDDLNARRGAGIRTVAILHEETAFGTGAARVTREEATRRGYEVVATIRHPNGARDVTRQASRLAALSPDALFQASYTPEAILFTRTFRRLGYAPNLLAYGAGYSDQAYFDAVGRAGNETISRAAWALDAVSERPAALAVARMFQERFGHPMDENSARTFTAAMTLFQAIDEAGGTDADAIREALAATDTPAKDTIMPWAGIRFGPGGQNELARGVILQRRGLEAARPQLGVPESGRYRLVWPFEDAAADLVWPVPPFGER